MSSPFLLGASATITRPDRTDNFIELLVGPVAYELKSKTHADVNIIKVHHQQPIFVKKRYPTENVFNEGLNLLEKSQERHQIIMTIIKELSKNKHNRIIAVSRRLGIVNNLFNDLETCSYDVGLITGKKISQEAIKKQILLGSIQCLGEGFDDASRNILLMLTPLKGMKNENGHLVGGELLEQVTGRVLRTTTQKAVIIDIVDENSMFKPMLSSRINFYNYKEWKISYVFN